MLYICVYAYISVLTLYHKHGKAQVGFWYYALVECIVPGGLKGPIQICGGVSSAHSRRVVRYEHSTKPS
jgi:hypothetical protein